LFAQERPRRSSKRAVAVGVIAGCLIVAGGILWLNHEEPKKHWEPYGHKMEIALSAKHDVEYLIGTAL
jgi:hypothetical protein